MSINFALLLSDKLSVENSTFSTIALYEILQGIKNNDKKLFNSGLCMIHILPLYPTFLIETLEKISQLNGFEFVASLSLVKLIVFGKYMVIDVLNKYKNKHRNIKHLFKKSYINKLNKITKPKSVYFSHNELFTFLKSHFNADLQTKKEKIVHDENKCWLYEMVDKSQLQILEKVAVCNYSTNYVFEFQNIQYIKCDDKAIPYILEYYKNEDIDKLVQLYELELLPTELLYKYADKYYPGMEIEDITILIYLMQLLSTSTYTIRINYKSIKNVVSTLMLNYGVKISQKIFINLHTSHISIREQFVNLITMFLQLEDNKIDEFVNIFIDCKSSHWENIKSKFKSYFNKIQNAKFPQRFLDDLFIDYKNQSFVLPELIEVFNEYCLVEEQGFLLRERKFTNNKYQILAVIRETMKEFYNNEKYPYNLQIINILALIKQKKRLAQINTGEGKSMIIAMLSAYCSITQGKVDVVTTSTELARRDSMKYSKFYEMLGLKCDYLPNKNAYLANIIYGTTVDFLGDYITEQTQNPERRIDRKFQTCIVDEVDSLFIDNATCSVRLLEPSGYEYIINDIWYRKHNILENPGNQRLKKYYLEGYYTSFSYKENVDYTIVKYDNDTVYKNTILGKRYAIKQSYKKCNCKMRQFCECDDTAKIYRGRIVPVDYNNTGEIQYNHNYSQGVQSFLERRHLLYETKDRSVFAEINAVSYFNFYKNIYGVSGTLGTHASRAFLYNLYGVDTFDSPSYKPNIKKELEPLVANSTDEHYELIIKEAKEIIKTRSILILCLTIKETLELSKRMKSKNLNFQVYNGIQSDPSEQLIGMAGSVGMITIATNNAGRGTDIVPTLDLIKNGGLHVCLTFPAKNDRVERQAFGRTGRQGAPGTYRYITCNVDIAKYREERTIKEIRDNECFIKNRLPREIFIFELQSILYNKPIDYRKKISPNWCRLYQRIEYIINTFLKNYDEKNTNECLLEITRELYNNWKYLEQPLIEEFINSFTNQEYKKIMLDCVKTLRKTKQ